MAVHLLPAFLQALLGFASGLLTLPQQRLLHQLTLAWLLGSGGKLIRAARITSGKHRTSLARFLNKSSWDAVAVLNETATGILKWMRPRRGEVLYLILDDTRNAKRGRTMPAVQKIWDHAAQQFVRGHIIVTAAVLFRGVTLPWRFTLWLPAGYCKAERLPYRRQTDIAAELIRDFTPPRGVQVRVLFDAFYLCKPVTAACENKGFTWFSVASRNRLLERDRGATRNLGDLAPGVVKHHGRSVRMKRARGWRWLRIATVVGRLKKIGTVRVVFSKRPRDPWRNLVAIATNETRLSAREVVANYERRWAVEVLFKELKGTLGLGEYQMQTRQGIERHLHLSGLAHLALTHHSLRTVGAQAKDANTDVPLPRFQERLDAVRAETRRHRVGRFVNRIRHKKVRNRVREYLLTDE